MRNGNRNGQEPLNYIYGRIPVLEYLNSGHVYDIFLQNGFSEQKIISAVKQRKLNPKYVTLEKLNILSNGGNHQGVVALIDQYKTIDMDTLIKNAKQKSCPVIVVLDEINDPHNLGAIVRNADAFSIDGIIMKDRHQVQLNSTVYKVSTGAINYVKIAVTNNLVNALKKLKNEGFWIYACSQNASSAYNEILFDRPTVIVFGNEGKGISRLVLENCDFFINIPMYGHVESLNVASTSAIIFSRIKNK